MLFHIKKWSHYTVYVRSFKAEKFCKFVDDHWITKLFLQNFCYTSTCTKFQIEFSEIVSESKWVLIALYMYFKNTRNPLLPDEKDQLSKVVLLQCSELANKQLGVRGSYLSKAHTCKELCHRKCKKSRFFSADNQWLFLLLLQLLHNIVLYTRPSLE